MKKSKVIKGKPIFIKDKARRLARQIHKDEHLIMDGEIEKKHKLNDWYYFMAAGLVVSLKEDMKEIAKQQKYLWQTLEEVIEELKKSRRNKNGKENEFKRTKGCFK